MKILFARLADFVLATLGAASAFGSTRLLHQPSYSQGRVAFVYQNDLWVAGEDGKNIRRLTATSAFESFPRFSPDGKWIAFSSNREGYVAVFAMPAAGGASKQLTFYGGADRVVGWTPDSKNVIFSSSRNIGFGGTQTLWIVPAAGGMERQLLKDRAAWGDYSQDMKLFAYNRHPMQGYRKHYRGSAAADLWVMDVAADKFRRLDDDVYRGNSAWPMFAKDGSIYYVADRLPNERTVQPGSLEVMKSANNIWKVSASGGKPAQITRHTSGNLFFPSMSGDGRTIVYEENFGIWKLDVPSGKTAEIKLEIEPTERESPVETITIDSIAESFDLSPSTQRAAIAARGRIFSIATGLGEVRRVTETFAHDRLPRWSPDGKWIVFLSDRSGRDEVWITNEHGAPPRKLTDIDGEKQSLVWLPDSKAVLYTIDEKIYRVPIEGGKQDIVARGNMDVMSLQPSPDGAWIAYATTVHENLVRTFIQPLSGGEPHAVAKKGFVRSYAPLWTPNGKKLLMLVSNSGAIDTPKATLYAIALQSEEVSPLYKGVDEEPPSPLEGRPAPGDGAQRKEAAKVQVKIDWEQIDRRTRQVIQLPETINSIAVSPDSRTYAMVSGGQIYTVDEDGGRQNRLTPAGPPAVAGAPTGPPAGMQFSRDGKTIFFREGSTINSVATTPAAAGGSGAGGPGAPATAKHKLTFTARVTANLREQRRYVFNEGWRMIKNRYYDKTMNGLDWEAIRREYEPLLDSVEDEEGLADLMRQMSGELNTSHVTVFAPPAATLQRAGSAHAGFELEPDPAGYYRISHILKNGPADKDYTKLKTGDFLIAVNGQPLKTTDNYWNVFHSVPGRSFELSLNSKPSPEGAWTTHVNAAVDSRTLYYDEWVAERKAIVDKQSNGDIAYTHIRIMSPDMLNQFEEELYEARAKKGLIIDVRFNGGGNLEMELLRILSQRHFLTLVTGKGFLFPRPFRGYFGKMVVLQNENSTSNSEMFPEAFRELGLGKTVGTPTPGYVLLAGDYELSDGLRVGIGHGTVKTLKGEYLENHGRIPDVLVDNSPEDAEKGRDAQLEKAVETLRQELR